jgi:uncharacterized protein
MMMHLHDNKTGLTVLDREECLEKLASQRIGRLGVIESRHPVVLPINFVLDGDAPVMATVEGVKARSARGRPACLEVDQIDVDRQTGWSVLVRGRLEDVSHDHEVLARVDPPIPWAPGEHPVILRLVPFSITGRAIGG